MGPTGCFIYLLDGRDQLMLVLKEYLEVFEVVGEPSRFTEDACEPNGEAIVINGDQDALQFTIV